MRPLVVFAALGCFLACPLFAVAQAPAVIEAPAEPLAAPVPLEEAPGRGVLTVTPEYVLWWLSEGRVPALLTTSSPASGGSASEPDTRVLYGDEPLQTRHEDRFNGASLAVEWMDAGGNVGVEARGFILERDSTYYKATSDGSVLLAEPYFNPVLGREESRIIAGPAPGQGFLSGAFVGYSRIEWFGEEVDAVLPLENNAAGRLDLLVGMRFLQMRDRFEDTAASWSIPAGAALYSAMDNFRVGNAFYGGQVGLRGETWLGRFFLQMRGTIALGGDAEIVRTYGQSVIQTPSGRVTAPVGMYVQPSNTGQFTHGNFDGVGEAAINVGYQLTAAVRVYVGYTFLYWADPLRAGDEVDTVVNRVQGLIPQPAKPSIPFTGEALWAQGVNVGLEVKW